jgi:polyhydroxyalkanoate synthase
VHSGHIAGVINPPKKNKRNYWSNTIKSKNADTWFKGAKYIEGSWWGDYQRLACVVKVALKIKAPTRLGSDKYKVIEPAPGSYVKEKTAKI